MARYLFKRKKKTDNFLSFWLLAMVFLVPAIVLEHVEAEEPQTSGLHAENILVQGKSLDIYWWQGLRLFNG